MIEREQLIQIFDSPELSDVDRLRICFFLMLDVRDLLLKKSNVPPTKN